MPLTKENINDISEQIKSLSEDFIKGSKNLKYQSVKLDRIFENYIKIRDNIKPHMLEPNNGNSKRIDRIKVASIMAICIIHVKPIELKTIKTKDISMFEKNVNIYLAYYIALSILKDFAHGDEIEGHLINSENYEISIPSDYLERFRKLVVNNNQLIKDINNIENIEALFFIIHIFYFINFMSQEKYQEKYLKTA